MQTSFIVCAPDTSTSYTLCTPLGSLKIGSIIVVALKEVGAEPVALNTDPDAVIVASNISVPSPKTFTVIPEPEYASASTFTKFMLVGLGKTNCDVLNVCVVFVVLP